MKNILGVYSKEYPTKILLQEKDLDTIEKLSQILKYRSHVYFTKEGIDFITSHFSFSQLAMFSTSMQSADELLQSLMNSSISNPDDVVIWNKDDLLRSMTGMDLVKVTDDFVVIYMDDPLPFEAEDLKRYLLMIKDKYDPKGFNEKLFDFVWNTFRNTKSYRNFFDVSDSFEDSDIRYTTYEIREHFGNSDDSMEKKLDDALKEIDLYIKEGKKPLLERDLPLYVMISIVSKLDRADAKVDEERKKIYLTLLDRLCEMKNPFGLETKAYACYCGNYFIGQDFKASEQCLLVLLDKYFRPSYSNTLGYIYYYGRVNHGIPEYEKALSYFTMAAISGNVEATYKLGDMYKNGYGVKKNEDAAFHCYSNLYWPTREEFLQNPYDSNFADVALRLAPFLAESQSNMEIRCYLEALMAIQLRNGQFDSGVKRGLVKSIEEWYKKHGNELSDDRYNFTNTTQFYGEFYVERKGNELQIAFDYKNIISDARQKNCMLTKFVKMKFEGDVLLDIHEKTRCDDIRYDSEKKCYSFSSESKDLLVIRADNMEVQFDYPLIEEDNDQTLYHIAQCQYTKNQGRVYTFLVLDEGTIEDSWVIEEDGKEIYPISFGYMTNKELPCDLSVMKHIQKK